MNKNELLQALEDEREKLLDLIEGLSNEEMVQTGAAGEWSVKDILAHLTRWEAELVRVLWRALQGQAPSSALPDGKDVDEVNARWHAQLRDRPLEGVLEDFHTVRTQTVRRVEAFKDDDLTDPRRYPWLKDTPLWKWIEEDSFGHEAEHAVQIREWLEKRSKGMGAA